MTWVLAGGLGASLAGSVGAGVAGGTAAGIGAGTAAGIGAGAAGLTAAELGSTAAPAVAEGATAAAPALEAPVAGMNLNEAMAPLDAQHGGPEQGMNPMTSIQNISQGDFDKELMAPINTAKESLSNISQGDIGAEIKNVDPIMGSLVGGGAEPPPMPAPPDYSASTNALDAQHGEKAPSTPGTPMSMQDKAKLAHNTLRIASSLVTNKKDKQTLGLMSLSTALASNGGDLNNSMSSMTGPLADISAGIQEPRLNQALSPLSPSTQQQPPKAPVSQSASPATARGTGFTPPTRLTGDQFAMQPSQRMSRYY